MTRKEGILKVQYGAESVAQYLGASSRFIRRELIKENAKHFTKNEIEELKKLSLQELTYIIEQKSNEKRRRKIREGFSRVLRPKLIHLSKWFLRS